MESNGLRERDSDGRFTGFRVNVEGVPRLPVGVARRALAERRPQVAFWLDDDDDLVYVGVVEPTADVSTVRIRQADHTSGELVAVGSRTLPRGGVDQVFVCPGCRRQRRHLYAFSVVVRRLTSGGGFRCRICAGLKFASQGSYGGALDRAWAKAANPGGYFALPRSPWNPRVVLNDPDAIERAFPDQVKVRCGAGVTRGVCAWRAGD